MRDDICTIPISEIFEENDGCPICRMYERAEKRIVEYILGDAMMEPDVRIETNRLGFCPEHFSVMLGMKNRLSLTLMLQSYLTELLNEGVIDNTKNLSKKDFEKITNKLKDSSEGCFICNRVKEKLKIYLENIVYLWEADKEFREKTRAQEYFCPKHLAALCETAKDRISKKNYSSFCEDHFSASRKILENLSDEVTRFCNSYNYMFRDVPLGEAKLAAEHTIDFLNGDIKK